VLVGFVPPLVILAPYADPDRRLSGGGYFVLQFISMLLLLFPFFFRRLFFLLMQKDVSAILVAQE